MSNENANQIGRKLGKLMDERIELRFGNLAALHRKQMSTVGPDNCDLIIYQDGLEVIGNKTAVVVQSFRPAAPQIIERQVVVARHDDLRLRKFLKIIPGKRELVSGSVLNQIA